MPRTVINALNAGELSPYLYARDDFDKYQSGCVTMENFVPLPYGGAIRRPAIEFIDASKSDDQIQGISFTASVEDSYFLEFGTEYIRFYKDGARLNETEIDIVESGTYQWTASGDEYYLEASGGGDPSVAEPDEIDENDNYMVAGTVGSLAVHEWGYALDPGATFYTIYVRTYNDTDPDGEVDGYLTAETIYEIGSPYTDTDLRKVKVAQSVDVMWLVHPDYPIQRLSRFSDTSWTIEDETFDFPPLRKENDTDITISPSATTGTITLAASESLFDSDQVGAYWSFDAIRTNNNRSQSGDLDATKLSEGISCFNSNWTASTTGTWYGKLVLQRSLDKGASWEDYVILADTREASIVAGAKNIAVSSEVPEPYNSMIRIHFVETTVSAGYYEITIEEPLFNSLVRISGYTSDTEVVAEVISDFQDVPSDYSDYSGLSGTIMVGTKAVINSSLDFSAPSINLTSIDAGLTDIVGSDLGGNQWWFVTNGASNKRIYKVDSGLTTLDASYDISSDFINVSDIAFYASELYVSGEETALVWKVKKYNLSGSLQSTVYTAPVGTDIDGLGYYNNYFYLGDDNLIVPSVIKFTTSWVYTGTFYASGSVGSQKDITGFNNLIYVINTNDNSVKYFNESLSLLGSYDVSSETTDPQGIAWDGTNLWVISGPGIAYKYDITERKRYYECVNQHGYASDFSTVEENWSLRTPEMKTWSEGAFSDHRGHPQAIALFEGRLSYAGTASNPDGLWLSATDDFSNFRLGSLATDAMQLNPNSGKLDEIRWLVAQENLVIGTAGSEWVLGASVDNLAVAPASFNLKRRKNYGSSDVQAILVNAAVLFIMRQGRKVREGIFQWGVDAENYVATDLTILAEHITDGGIKQWAFQQQPDNVLWCIRDDGTLLGFTYERDQNVVGWHRHTLEDGSGEFESVTVIPIDEEEDEVWVTCKLTVDGNTKRYIGRLDDREWGSPSTYATNYRGSDFYKVYTSPGSTTLRGLEAWEGKTLDVVADGVVQDSETVSGGSITVDSAAYTTVVVGIPYDSTVAPMYLEVDSQGMRKGLRNAKVRFKDTFSAKTGRRIDDLESVKFDLDETALYSDTRQVYMSNASEHIQTCYIKQDEPMPCTVLALIAEVEA